MALPCPASATTPKIRSDVATRNRRPAARSSVSFSPAGELLYSRRAGAASRHPPILVLGGRQASRQRSAFHLGAASRASFRAAPNQKIDFCEISYATYNCASLKLAGRNTGSCSCYLILSRIANFRCEFPTAVVNSSRTIVEARLATVRIPILETQRPDSYKVAQEICQSLSPPLWRVQSCD